MVQPTLLGLLPAPPKRATARSKRRPKPVVDAAPILRGTFRERRYSDEIAEVEDTCWSLMRENIDPYVVARFNVDGEPVSKARPRFVQFGGRVKTYTPKKTRDSENEVAWHFRQARPDWQVDGASGFGVFAVFFAEGFQRRDVDNMLKLVLDALNGVVWADDSQVTEVSGRQTRGGVEFTGGARTAIMIYRTMTHVQPSRACQRCGTSFVLYPSQRARKFCNRACATAARTGVPSGQKKPRTCVVCNGQFMLTPTQNRDKKYCSDDCRKTVSTASLTCVQCGTGFTQWTSWKPSGAALCSRECGVAFWKSNGTKSAHGTCSECGGPVSRKEYKRCRSCVRAATPPRARGPITGASA